MAYTTIDNPVEYFNTKLYTGTGSSQSITGVGFQPDWVWLKDRTSAYNHAVFDKVRGVQKRIFTNLTNAEDTASDTLTAFDSDGFTIGNNVGINTNTNNYVSWNWKANGAGVSNTAGTISSTVSANTTSGFSIVSYTGTGANATVGHGLNAVPSMVIVKSRSNPPADHWFVYHKSTGNTGSTYLNLTSAFATGANDWNNTTPTSSVFSIGTQTGINYNGGTFIAYCFAEVKGFSKFGSYTGNGSTDGTFVYLGFKPAFLLFKRSSGAGNNWVLLDNKRNTFNIMGEGLFPNSSDAGFAYSIIDFTSNGFKLRASDVWNNGSGETIIYMAFAEQPLVGTNNVPATAR